MPAIKETKELLIGVNEVGVVLAGRLKDGFQADDFAAFYAKLFNDPAFKLKVQDAYENIGDVPSEVADLSLGEAVELATVQISYIPKIIEALK